MDSGLPVVKLTLEVDAGKATEVAGVVLAIDVDNAGRRILGEDLVEKILTGFDTPPYQIAIGGGEPTTHPDFIHILKRARELAGEGQDLFATPTLRYFLYHKIDREAFASDPRNLEWFCRLDDSDIMVSIKEWQFHEDATLATLSKMLILRKLYKVALSSDSLARYLEEKVEETSKRLSIDPSLMPYFVFGGRTSINSYKINEELINIETKSGILKNITEIDDSLVSHTLTGAVYKNYVCFVPELVF